MCTNNYSRRFPSPLIAYISTFPPSHCGLASFSSELVSNLHNKICRFNPLLVRLEFDKHSVSNYANGISLIRWDKSRYIQIANLINDLLVYAVNLQHEFKIFGGKHGEYILFLLEHLRKPVLTTFHTIWPNFSGNRRRVFMQVAKKSDAIIALSNRGAEILIKNYHIPISKIHIVPHGVPDLPFVYPSKSKLRSKWQYDTVFISAGFLRQSKGIEYALWALAALRQTYPNFMYFILGKNHPRRKSAIEYRNYLQRMIDQLGLDDNVTFINQYLSLDEMIEYIWASDICLVPYLRKEQSSSGVLALFMACGRPIISTDFQYAKAVGDNKVGIITKRKDSDALLKGIKYLIANKKIRMAMMNTAYERINNWKWPIVAERYLEIIEGLINRDKSE